MNAKISVFDTKTNVGEVDRYFRVALGMSLIAVPLFYDGVDAEFAALTSLIAIPIMFTAIVKWCPVYAFMHVQSVKHKYDSSRFYGKNVSKSDGWFRYALGAALILVTMMFTSVADPWLVIPALIAIPVIYTAITNWDPLYALFEIGTYKPRLNSTKAGSANVVMLHSRGTDDVPPHGSGQSTNKAA